MTLTFIKRFDRWIPVSFPKTRISVIADGEGENAETKTTTPPETPGEQDKKKTETKDKDDGTTYVPKTELDSVIKSRQKLEEKLKNQSTEYTKVIEELTNVKKSLEALGDDPTKVMEELKTLKEAAEKEKLKDASELEKAQHALKKMQGQIDELMSASKKELETREKAFAEEKEKTLKQLENLRNHQLTNEILVEATNNNAYNPTQIVNMLRHEFKYDTDTDAFVHEYEGSKGAIHTKSVSERVKEFLTDENNRNLVRAGSSPRSGAKPGEPGDNKKTEAKPGDAYSVDKEGYMTLGRELTADEKREADMSGLNHKEFEDRKARMLKAIADNDKRSQEMAKAGPRPLLPGEVPLRDYVS
jgi:hypothetical protein